MPEERSTFQARVYLILDTMFEDEFVSSVVVDLPKVNPTRTIEIMQKHGFWVPRPEIGMMKFFAPNQIRQVHMIVDENARI